MESYLQSIAPDYETKSASCSTLIPPPIIVPKVRRRHEVLVEAKLYKYRILDSGN